MKPHSLPSFEWSEKFSHWATTWAGSTGAFMLALVIIVVWIVTGPYFDFSDTWQLVINTGTTIITFLMVFLIQRTQNKEAAALQMKLNEILAALEGASNRLINVEDLTEQEMKELQLSYKELAAMTRRNGDLRSAHSIEELKSHAEKLETQAEELKTQAEELKTHVAGGRKEA